MLYSSISWRWSEKKLCNSLWVIGHFLQYPLSNASLFEFDRYTWAQLLLYCGCLSCKRFLVVNCPLCLALSQLKNSAISENSDNILFDEMCTLVLRIQNRSHQKQVFVLSIWRIFQKLSLSPNVKCAFLVIRIIIWK